MVNSLREFYCIIDMLIGAVRCGDILTVSVKCSGIIKRYVDGKKDIARITESPAKIKAVYDDSGFIVSSTVTKSVVKWLSSGNVHNHKPVNSYLTFLDDIDEIAIESVMFNGKDVVDDISSECKISIYDLVRFVSNSCDSMSIKLNLNSGNKKISLIYDNGVFYRYVKFDDLYTLYINDCDKFYKHFNNYKLSGFMFGCNIPDMTSQLDLLKYLADVNGCDYRYM